MPRIAYVNGRYEPHANASVHVEDRGYQFADGVYEVCEIHHGAIIDLEPHLDRLDRSLNELSIAWPMSRRALPLVMREVAARNGVHDGIVYIQVTRGVAPRDHAFPKKTRPALVVTAKAMDRSRNDRKREEGVHVVTVANNRWERVDIKTVGLLPNVLARQEAIGRGADEAWFVAADGTVLEGASTNAWIVKDGTILTREAEQGILKGITRQTILKVAEALQLTVEERSFTVEEARHADEAFNTAASTLVMPVISIDAHMIGKGTRGPVTQRLQEAYHDIAERTPA